MTVCSVFILSLVPRAPGGASELERTEGPPETLQPREPGVGEHPGEAGREGAPLPQVAQRGSAQGHRLFQVGSTGPWTVNSTTERT